MGTRFQATFALDVQPLRSSPIPLELYQEALVITAYRYRGVAR